MDRQLDELAKGITILSSVHERTSGFRESLESMERLTVECGTLFTRDYPAIEAIATAHSNSVKIKNLIKELESLPDTFARIFTSLDSYREQRMKGALQENPVMMNELLRIHYQLAKIDRFLCSISYSSTKSVKIKLSEYLERKFRQLDECRMQFEVELWEWTLDLFELSKAAPQAIMKLMKIIEYEERMDRLKADHLGDQVMRLSKIRNYFETFKSQQRNLVKNRFEELVRAVEHEIDLELHQLDHENAQKVDIALTTFEKTLRRVLILVVDLQYIRERLEPLFPRKFEILKFYVSEYHRNVHRVILNLTQKVGSKHLPPKNTLFLLRWIQDYYGLIRSHLGLAQEDGLLQPSLWSEPVSRFVDDYVSLLRTKLDEWTKNLVRNEDQEYSGRSRAPEIDINGKYMTESSSILFQLVDQQIDVCLQSNKGYLLTKIVWECCESLKRYQKATKKLLKSQTHQFLDNPKGSPSGIVEYWMAAANNHSLYITCFTELAEKVRQQIDKSFAEEIDRLFSETMAGFHEVIIEALNDLILIILVDLKEPFETLFTPVWYEDKTLLAQSIIATLNDYRNDFEKHLLSPLFPRLMILFAEMFVIQYLKSLILNRDGKVLLPHFFECSLEDKRLYSQFFLENIDPHGWYMSAKAWQNVLDLVSEQLVEDLINHIVLFMQSYPDCEWKLLEGLLRKRVDLERSTVKDIIKQAKSYYVAPTDQTSIEKSIFSKIVLS